MIPRLAFDSISGAPDNGWTAVGVIGGMIGAAIIYGAVQLIKAWRAPTPRTETIAGQRYDVTGMSESLVQMLSDALNRAHAAEDSATEARRENAAHETRIGHLESDRTALVAEVAALRQGVKNGTIPPAHPMPERLRHLFEPGADV